MYMNGTYIRVLGCAVTSVLMIISSPLHAFGLGEPQLKSYLSEPLFIEIPLRLSEEEKDLNISASQTQSRTQVNEWVPDLRFEQITKPDGDISLVAKTRTVINEPIVHFTLRVSAGQLQIERELSFLIDPKPVIQAAVSAARPKANLKIQRNLQRRPITSESSIVSGPISRYTIQSGDTLSRIAQRIRQENQLDASAEQTMVALYNHNPQAFIAQDINRIKASHTLDVPDNNQINSLDPGQAKQRFQVLLNGTIGEQVKPVEAATAEIIVSEPGTGGTPDQQISETKAEEPITSKPLPDTEPSSEPSQLKLSGEEAEDEAIPAEGSGTVVYEAPETSLSKAIEPDPEVKARLNAEVTEMEKELAKLRNDVTKLRQSLYQKEELLSLKAETKIHSLERVTDQTQEPQAEHATSITEEDSPIPQAEETNYLRLLIEIITILAAIGLIAYFIFMRRKSKDIPSDDDQELVWTPPEEDITEPDAVSTMEAASEEVSNMDSSQPADSEPTPDDQATITEEAAPEPAVSEENLLQEADMCIAFGDMDNAYRLMLDLIGIAPENPAYRLQMLEIVMHLDKQDEFIYHANHLASITQEAEDSEWPKAVELGQSYIPDHLLFSGEKSSLATSAAKQLDESDTDLSSTVVMQAYEPDEGDQEHSDTVKIPSSDDGTYNLPLEDEDISGAETMNVGTVSLDDDSPLSFDELLDNETAAPATPEEPQISASEAPTTQTDDIELQFDDLLDNDDFLHEDDNRNNNNINDADTMQVGTMSLDDESPLSFDELLSNDEINKSTTASEKGQLSDELSPGEETDHVLEFEADTPVIKTKDTSSKPEDTFDSAHSLEFDLDDPVSNDKAEEDESDTLMETNSFSLDTLSIHDNINTPVEEVSLEEELLNWEESLDDGDKDSQDLDDDKTVFLKKD